MDPNFPLLSTVRPERKSHPLFKYFPYSSVAAANFPSAEWNAKTWTYIGNEFEKLKFSLAVHSYTPYSIHYVR